MYLPEQRIPFNRKDKEWRKKCADFLCNKADEFQYDKIKMIENYRIKNSLFSQEEFAEICNTLGVNDEVGKKYVEIFNTASNIIDAMKTEETNRPLNYNIQNESSHTINEVLRQREIAFKQYLESFRQRTIEKVSMIDNLNNRMESGEITLNKYNEEIENINRYLSDKYKINLDTNKLLDKTNNILSVKEDSMNKLLKLIIRKNKIPVIKNKTFEDVLLVAKEFVEIFIEREGELPKVRELNPVDIFYDKSPNIEYIQNGDYAGYKEEITVSQLLREDSDKINSKDLERIDRRNYGYGYESNRGNFDYWDNTLTHNPANRVAFMDGTEGVIPNYGGGTDFMYSSGLNTDYKQVVSNYVVRYTFYWISYRKVAYYHFINEYGELDKEIVDEDFVVPKNAKREVYKKDMYADDKVRYVWYKNNKFNAIEYVYLPEVWKGKRINGDIYYAIEPLEHGHKSLLNPYSVKLPIYGKVYNNRNAPSLSVMDKIKPYTKLYIFIMSKLMKNIANDLGNIIAIESSMINAELGVNDTLKILRDLGIIVYSKYANNQGTNFSNTDKIITKENASNAENIAHYINLLEFIDEKIKQATGMSNQRLAQTSNNTTATDNARDTMYSHNITASLFNSHELLWEEILQGLLEMTHSVVSFNSGIIRGYLNDEELALIDLDNIELEDEYALHLVNSDRNMKIMELSYNHLHALIQNDKLDFLTFIDLLNTEDIRDFRKQIKELQETTKKQQESLQQQADAKEKEIAKLETDRIEDSQKHDIDMEVLKADLRHKSEKELAIIKGKLLALSYDEDKDSNNNGVKDYLEIEKLQHKVDIDTAKLKLENDKLQQRNLEIANNKLNKDKALNNDRRNKANN
jgi:hypothetical protein